MELAGRGGGRPVLHTQPELAAMPPLTLTILASLLQLHGPDAAVASDNKGLDDLLAGVREELQDHAVKAAPQIMEARGSGASHPQSTQPPATRARPADTWYTKTFKKIYIRTTYVKTITGY